MLVGEAPRKAVDKRLIERRIKGHNAADLKAGREVGDLDVEWVLNRFKLQRGLCALCKGEMEKPRVGVMGAKGQQLSIDRIVSEGRGHVRGNCWLTHASCNFAKGAREV